MSFNPEVPLRKFVSENEIEDKKHGTPENPRKQDEPSDNRPLYEKLKENQMKTEEAFQERIKFTFDKDHQGLWMMMT